MTADTAATRIAAPARAVFDFLADPEKLTLWSFGTWRIEPLGDGLLRGHALATGAQICLRIDPDPARLLIDYHLGPDPGALCPRIFARVIPGPVTGHAEESATLLMTGLRSAEMDDARWQGLIRAHAFEVDTIRGLIESGHDHRIG
jgi:hypothetical protein